MCPFSIRGQRRGEGPPSIACILRDVRRSLLRLAGHPRRFSNRPARRVRCGRSGSSTTLRVKRVSACGRRVSARRSSSRTQRPLSRRTPCRRCQRSFCGRDRSRRCHSRWAPGESDRCRSGSNFCLRQATEPRFRCHPRRRGSRSSRDPRPGSQGTTFAGGRASPRSCHRLCSRELCNRGLSRAAATGHPTRSRASNVVRGRW